MQKQKEGFDKLWECGTLAESQGRANRFGSQNKAQPQQEDSPMSLESMAPLEAH